MSPGGIKCDVLEAAALAVKPKPIGKRKKKTACKTNKSKKKASKAKKTRKLTKKSRIQVGQTVSGPFGNLLPLAEGEKRRKRARLVGKSVKATSKGEWEVMFLDGNTQSKKLTYSVSSLP